MLWRVRRKLIKKNYGALRVADKKSADGDRARSRCQGPRWQPPSREPCARAPRARNHRRLRPRWQRLRTPLAVADASRIKLTSATSLAGSGTQFVPSTANRARLLLSSWFHIRIARRRTWATASW